MKCVKIIVLMSILCTGFFGLISMSPNSNPSAQSLEADALAKQEEANLSESVIEISKNKDHFDSYASAQLTPDKFDSVPNVPGWYTPKGHLSSIFEDLTYYTNNAEVYSGIRAGYFYAPESSNPRAKPIVIVVVHGTGFSAFGIKTGGAATVDYFDPTTESFKGILNFARSEADKAQAPVQVVSFQWSGANTTSKRIDPGAVLANVLKRYANFKILTISHSHGGNIVNIASNQPNVPLIDTMIQVATPVRDIKAEGGIYVPKNFNTLFQFWSSNDFVVLAGAVSSWADFYAGEIFKRSTRKYIPLINPNNPLYRQGAYNPFVTFPQGMVYNIRSQVNGAFVGHSWIDELTPVLIPTLQEIRQNYKANTDLELDVETKSHEVIVAIRHALQETVYYKDFLKPLSDIDPIFKTVLDNQERQEKQYSDLQKARYFALHKIDMNLVDPKLRAAVRKLESAVQTAASYVPNIPLSGILSSAKQAAGSYLPTISYRNIWGNRGYAQPQQPQSNSNSNSNSNS
ncbi:hypothetical protein H0X48_00410 [Candidatus Dependentiae bacterium]|nr:hypothetical protein [Candidatus Dependentiae bacterium]